MSLYRTDVRRSAAETQNERASFSKAIPTIMPTCGWRFDHARDA
jgi:hypothetical protein